MKLARPLIPVFDAGGKMTEKVGPEFFETDAGRYDIARLVTRRDGAVSCVHLKGSLVRLAGGSQTVYRTRLEYSHKAKTCAGYEMNTDRMRELYQRPAKREQ